MLTCALGDPGVPEPVYRAWHGLHRELAGLSSNSRHIVSASPDHYLNFGDPELVIDAVRDVVRAAQVGQAARGAGRRLRR